MATKVKPSRINITGVPSVGQVPMYVDDDTFQWGNGGGGGDMLYSDFYWDSESGASITLSLSTEISPTANFTVNAPTTIKEGQVYVLRVTNGATAYTMTLGTNISNTQGADTTLTANATDMFVFLGVGGTLELQREINTVSFAKITGQPTDNANLSTALNGKLNTTALSDTNYGGAWSGDTTHAATKNAIYTKIHTMDVEIGNKAADTTVVKLSGNQTISDTKTFTTSPVVPSKTSDATNTGTAIATEAQVYKKQDTLTTQTAYTSKGTSTKVATITTNTLGQVTSVSETSIDFPVTSVNGSTGAVSLSIPTKTSDLNNDSGFLTSAVTSFNGNTGAVTYTAPVTSVNGNTGAVTVSAFSPSNAGSTGNVLTKTAGGYERGTAPATGIQNDTTGTTTTVTAIRAGTEAEYALITPVATTVYIVM